MRRGVLGVILLFMVVMPVVSSTILIEDDFDNVYSVGDKAELEFSISSNSVVSDFVESYLKCDGDSELIDKRYIFLDNEKKDFSLEFPLMSEGECQFEVEFRNEEDVSEEFRISDKIEIDYEINGKSFFPEEEILINGTARKANGKDFGGIVDLNIEGLTQKSVEVVDGDFSFSYFVKKDAKPKDYDLKLNIKEKNVDENVLNSGYVNQKITVKSKPTSILIEAVDYFQPPYNLSFKLKLLNQVGDLIKNETIIAKIRDYDNFLIYQDEVKSGVSEVLFFPGTTKRGSAYLSAYYGGINEEIPIYVEDYESVNVTVVPSENVLRFANDGNVLYEGSVDFDIEGPLGVETILINITLPVGEVFDYSLEYTGHYNITSEGEKFFNIPLTGYAIGSEGEMNWSSLIVFVVFCLILIFGYIHVRQKRKEHFPLKEKVECSPEMVSKIEKEVKTRQVYVKEEEEKKIEVKRDVYMLFVKSVKGVSEYSGIVEKYGSRLHIVDDELGYVVFYGVEGMDSDHKLYKLAKNIKKFANVKEDKVSLVLNKGYFEKKISLLKKFALINKKLLLMFPHKVVVGDKLMERVGGQENFSEEIVEVDLRKMRVWVV